MRIIQGIWGDTPERIHPCLDSVKRIYPQVEVFRFTDSKTPIVDSDHWRWEMMLKYNDILYIDWDIILHEPLIFSDNKLFSSMAFWGRRPDNCLMYSPDQRIFQEFEDKRIKMGLKFTDFAWYRKLLRDETVYEIKHGFTHLRASGFFNLRKQYRQFRRSNNDPVKV